MINAITLPDALECEPVANLFRAYDAIARRENEEEWGTVFRVQ